MAKDQRPEAIRNRTRYPEEQQYAWLPPILDAYALLAEGQQKELLEATQGGRNVACGKGCSACCEQAVVPIMRLEIPAVSWYVCEQLDRPTQDRLIPRLLGHRESMECPFLLDGACSIYLMRPLACRSLVVLEQRCTPDENVMESRPYHVFIQTRSLSKRVALRILDAERWPNNTKKAQAFEMGFMEENCVPMHALNWEFMPENIKHFRELRETAPKP